MFSDACQKEKAFWFIFRFQFENSGFKVHQKLFSPKKTSRLRPQLSVSSDFVLTFSWVGFHILFNLKESQKFITRYQVHTMNWYQFLEVFLVIWKNVHIFEVWGKCVVINCKILSNKLFQSSFIIGQSRNFSNLEFLWKCWILRLEHG